jgi:2-polyprenyl-6-methoxyphenol hydroxylase-like FAD-dependent oxidoreductase
VIAIAGGGASGTLAAIYLLREAASRRTPLRIALIDRHRR